MVLTGLTAAGGGQIFDPQGERVLGLAQTAAADRLIPDQTGFYEIRGNDGVRWVAVNVDARESDLTPLPASFVQRWRAMQVRQHFGDPRRPHQARNERFAQVPPIMGRHGRGGPAVRPRQAASSGRSGHWLFVDARGTAGERTDCNANDHRPPQASLGCPGA